MSAGRVITCTRCHRQARNHGRGLCSACYQKIRGLERTKQFDRTYPEQTSMYCPCAIPSPVRIGLFQATYCDTCGRAIRGVT